MHVRWTADERPAWLATLEAEERQHLESLRESIGALAKEEKPRPRQINALLVSAIQAQVALMRMSRVFPDRASTRRTDVNRALGHGPTAALARELHRGWKALGVSDPTLEVLLRQVVLTIGDRTRTARANLFVDLVPDLRKGVDPGAHRSLAAEGAGQFLATCLEE